jgi:hypothetical protein
MAHRRPQGSAQFTPVPMCGGTTNIAVNFAKLPDLPRKAQTCALKEVS